MAVHHHQQLETLFTKLSQKYLVKSISLVYKVNTERTLASSCKRNGKSKINQNDVKFKVIYINFIKYY